LVADRVGESLVVDDRTGLDPGSGERLKNADETVVLRRCVSARCGITAP
jgi:hypothetical protein